MLKNLLDWVDERTGLVSAVHHFLDEDIPASAGWHQVFGSVALFAFLCQVVSGLLMSVNYAPTPSEAWDSLRYIVTQVSAGSIVRAMHHWGASAMIVVVVLHMLQVFIWGAYKKPREATWMIGVVLLLITLAFGLSGYLLAWDNRAYWGTMVTTQITKLAPGGDLILRLLGTDGDSIGRVTFARFYAAHVTLLPIVTLLLIVLHVILVRKHGVTPAPGDENRPKKKFFPEQVYKDTVATFAWFAVLALMVAFVKVPLGNVADPTDTSYIPRPEWYFLFLFQMLKVFEGKLEVVGAIILPGIAVGSLLLMPFIDRAKAIQVRQRTTAIGVVVLAALGWAGLTARAVATTPQQFEEDGAIEVASWQRIPAAQLAGIGVFRQSNCVMCHALGRSGPGPDLAKAPSLRQSDWLEEHFRKPGEGVANDLTGANVRALVALVSRRDERGVDAWQNAPDNVIPGAALYNARGCGACHIVNGEGGKSAPSLNGLRLRRQRDYVAAHFENPKAMSPGSTMPPYKFAANDLNAITDYVMSIPK